MSGKGRDEEEKREEKGRFIVERHYIHDADIVEAEKMVYEGVDISGRWNTMVIPRTITDADIDPTLVEQAKKLPGGAHIDRCWQCGNCTAICPTAHDYPEFNPRLLIYLVKVGYKSLIKKYYKDTVYRCAGCGECSTVCPKDVDPHGVMMALSILFERIAREDGSK